MVPMPSTLLFVPFPAIVSTVPFNRILLILLAVESKSHENRRSISVSEQRPHLVSCEALHDSSTYANVWQVEQGRHADTDVIPICVLYVPAGQETQTSAVISYCPAGQTAWPRNGRA